jgi:regulator of sirC expression with transglutaminase-like and TPR domain
MPVIFPTQLILRADWIDEEMWLINPFNGDTLDEHTLEAWLKGNIGPVAELYDDDLQEAEPQLVLNKMLDTLKSALMEEKQMELALQVSQVLVQMDPEDPYEIRDRGLIFAQLECEHVALTDLTYFVEQCPEDPVSEMIKLQIHSIEQKQITLH